MAQRLANQASRYLLQHADDPIDWWTWSDEAFAEARRIDRPVLISIGYSSCHWCHVMGAETFADPAVAELVNRSFVCIKVDREEHPDVDQVFMRVTQSLTGQGGWPNTVFCTPQGQPFFAGGYFPPEPGNGLPSFTELIGTLADAWQTRLGEVVESAQLIVSQLTAMDASESEQISHRQLAPDALTTTVLSGFDDRHGGFGGAPKFPQAPVLDALFVRTDQAANDAALFALEAMARGGIRDQVGGGFHRYCVDAGWEVPHFEKMLYDNALLLGTYTRGWLRAIPDDGTEQREIFKKVVHDIAGWLIDEMLLDSGGFAASLDADSADESGQRRDGAYYVWSPQLFDEYLGKDSRFAQGVFHVTVKGNMPQGAHSPTDGSGLSTLQFHGLPHPGRLANVIAVLKEVRARRERPSRDDKVVAAWNGLLIDSLVRAGMVFGKPEWCQKATACAQYLWSAHWDTQRRILARSSMAGTESVSIGADGVCADYASTALGFLTLAQLGDPVWATRAVELLDRAIELFSAPDGGFYENSPESQILFERPRRPRDEELPSATSIMQMALMQASKITGRGDLADRAHAAGESLRCLLAEEPSTSGWGLASVLAESEAQRGWGPAEIIVADNSEQSSVSSLAKAIWRLAPWGSVIVGAGQVASNETISPEKEEINGQPTAYICRGQRCLPPITDWAQLRSALWET